MLCGAVRAARTLSRGDGWRLMVSGPPTNPTIDSCLPPFVLPHFPPPQVYVEYTDASFTTPKLKPASHGLLGPVLRAEVGQVLEIVFQVRPLDTVFFTGALVIWLK